MNKETASGRDDSRNYSNAKQKVSEGKTKKAVALSYNVNKDEAPRVVAAGQGLTAEKICRIAQENQVPLYKNEGMAERLVRQELNTPIPAELYTAVAEILAFVYQLDHKDNR
jgi:flagellar biosynthesis protein